MAHRSWIKRPRRHPLASVVASLLLVVGCNTISGADRLSVDHVASTEEPIDAAEAAPQTTPDAADAPDTSTADAALVDAESDAEPQPGPPKHVFVTTALYDGNFHGRAGADAICQTLGAKTKVQNATWVAWLSTTKESALARITHPGAYVLLDNATVVVHTRAQWSSGAIEHAIDMTESGVAFSQNHGVWTGTRPDGTPDATCNDWASNSSSDLGTLASAKAVDGGWTKGAGPAKGQPLWTCDTSVSLYCFEL